MWEDLEEDLVAGDSGDFRLSVNVAAVRTSIDNILRTFPGERVMLPTFASRLRHLLFEPLAASLEGFVSREIKRVIERWDNRVQVLDSNYTIDSDHGEISLSIQFSIVGFDGVFPHQVTL